MLDSELEKRLEEKSVDKVRQTNPVLKKVLVKLINGIGSLLFLFQRNKLPREVKKILFVSLNFNGDILFGSTLFNLVRSMYPGAEFHIWIKSRTKHMLTGYPYFEKVFVFNEIRTRKYDEEIDPSLSVKLKFFKELRNEKYDMAFDITGLFWTAFGLFYSGVKYKAGYNFQGFGFFYNFETAAIQKGHLIDKHLSVVTGNKAFEDLIPQNLESFKKPSFEIDRSAAKKIDEILLNSGISKENKMLLLHTTAGWEAKKWDVTNFIELINGLDENIFIFIIGGKEDSATADIIKRGTDRVVHDLTGKLTIGESAELLSRASLFIGTDSGPLYLAEAVGTPTLSLFGPTNPLFSAPRGEKHSYLYEELFCSAPVDEQNCRLLAGLNCRTVDCMKLLKPAIVLSRVNELLSVQQSKTGRNAEE
jgi:ADP-heptose:LPS heptosyltransferase